MFIFRYYEKLGKVQAKREMTETYVGKLLELADCVDSLTARMLRR